MHYIVVQNCITLQYNSLMRIMDPLDAGGRFPRLQYWGAIGTYLELGQANITVMYLY